MAIVENQAGALRKRWLIPSFLAGLMDGASWGLRSARTSYERGDTLGYSKDLARKVIAAVRTDPDAFSAGEAAVAIPHPGWLDAAQVRRALAGSGRRTLLGRW